MSAVQGAQHASLLLLGVAFGAISVGAVSDRLRSRSGVMRVYAFLYALSWLPWIGHVSGRSRRRSHGFSDGRADPRLHAVVDRRQGSQSPRALRVLRRRVVNVGIFLGTGILQPLIGRMLDVGRAAGDVAAAWDRGIAVFAGVSAFGALMTLFVRRK